MKIIFLPLLFVNTFWAFAQPTVSWFPNNPTRNDTITVTIQNAAQGAFLHWGVDNINGIWNFPHPVYWPSGSFLAFGAVESPFNGSTILKTKIGPFNNAAQSINRIAFAIRYADSTWDNNSSLDYHIEFLPIVQENYFILDGIRDSNSTAVLQKGQDTIYAGWNGMDLYVGMNTSSIVDKDLFIFASKDPTIMKPAVPSWKKKGMTGKPEFFLGRESTNGWAGFFDSIGGLNWGRTYGGKFLEGVFPLKIIDSTWQTFYIAIGYYETQDSGALVYQIPSGNGDLNIDPNEWEKFEIKMIQTGVVGENYNPSQFVLNQNYPNPFNPSTVISYHLPAGQAGLSVNNMVSLKIYDLLGREVATIVNEEQSAGWKEVEWNAAAFSSGIYFYKLTAGGFAEVKKLMLLK